MIMSEKSKQHVDSCRFCWMCHHICPIGNATGQERNTARARALGISLVNRGAIELSEIMDNIYECATCGACVQDCTTGWDPVMFTKETRMHAALDGELPAYIETLVNNCLETGNVYGKTSVDETLKTAMDPHASKTDTLFYLGADAVFMVPDQAAKAIRVLEHAGADFTTLESEPSTGAQLDFLIGAAQETKQQMLDAAKLFNTYQTVVVYDPNDAKCIKQTWKEYGIVTEAKVVTYTSYVADLLRKGALIPSQSGLSVVYQDPYQLSRDLGEIEEAREIIGAYANLEEMLLVGTETVWAGNILMAQYMPEIIKKVAARRLFNVTSIGKNTLVTASVAEYHALKSVDQTAVTILSLEDLILGE